MGIWVVVLWWVTMVNGYGFCSLMGHDCEGEDGFTEILFGLVWWLTLVILRMGLLFNEGEVLLLGGCFNRWVWFIEFPLRGWRIQSLFFFFFFFGIIVCVAFDFWFFNLPRFDYFWVCSLWFWFFGFEFTGEISLFLIQINLFIFLGLFIVFIFFGFVHRVHGVGFFWAYKNEIYWVRTWVSKTQVPLFYFYFFKLKKSTLDYHTTQVWQTRDSVGPQVSQTWVPKICYITK